MKKIIVSAVIFEKHYDGIITGVKFADLPNDLLPDDVIDIEKEPGYYSDNESYDDSSRLIIYRKREETDEEFAERKEFWDDKYAEDKVNRYNRYLQLKKEFENQPIPDA